MIEAGKLENLNDLVAGARVSFTEAGPGIVLAIMGAPMTKGIDGPVVSARAHIKHTNGNESFHTFRHDGRSTHSSNMDITMILPEKVDAQPPAQVTEVDKDEWDGEGLPPVGVECEFNHPDFGWTPCEVVGQYCHDAVCAPNGGGYFGGRFSDFRPIKSERDKVIHEAKAQLVGAGDDILAALYDAGMLKMPD